jgi:hypothetical protein
MLLNLPQKELYLSVHKGKQLDNRNVTQVVDDLVISVVVIFLLNHSNSFGRIYFHSTNLCYLI